MHPAMFQIFELVLIGAAAGILGGLLGIGGGIIMIPALTFIFADTYGPDSFHAYNLASISAAFVLAIPAAIRHLRSGVVITRLLGSVVPLALIGIIGGVLLGACLTGERTRLLKQIFGGCLEFAVLVNLIQERLSRAGEPHLFPTCPMPRRWAKIGFLVGLPSGVIAGLLGVGGGIWAVPSQTLLLGIRLRNAIATSMVMIIPVALVASLAMAVKLALLPHNPEHPPLHLVAWSLTLYLAPGAFGGRLVRREPDAPPAGAPAAIRVLRSAGPYRPAPAVSVTSRVAQEYGAAPRSPLGCGQHPPGSALGAGKCEQRGPVSEIVIDTASQKRAPELVSFGGDVDDTMCREWGTYLCGLWRTRGLRSAPGTSCI